MQLPPSRPSVSPRQFPNWSPRRWWTGPNSQPFVSLASLCLSRSRRAPSS